MMNCTEALHKMPIVGIVRDIAMDDFIEILPLYIEAGLTTIEVTLNTPGAVGMIEYANLHYGDQLVTGAGTICTMDDLQAALGAGSKFIVTPITDTEVIQTCLSASIPVFPGAYTATEIYQAWKAGASMVKVFPAGAAGPQYIKDIRGPLKQVPLMPTGGVELSNMLDFFEAGATAVGIGGKLFSVSLINEKKWNELRDHFRAYVDLLRNNTDTL